MKNPYPYIVARMKTRRCRICRNEFRPRSGVQKTCLTCRSAVHPCRCGCGRSVPLTLSYVHGHNGRGPKPWRKLTRLCACGCGTRIKAYGERPSIIRRYVSGHNGRKPQIAQWLSKRGRVCACGCGKRIKRTYGQWKYGLAKYISGHNPPPRGQRHFNWRGGSSDFRPRVENHKAYRHWRSIVLKRAGRRCELCGSLENVEVAHRIPFAEIVRRAGRNIRQVLKLHVPKMGMALCRRCHRGKKTSGSGELPHNI